jgi:hypothetical protein
MVASLQAGRDAANAAFATASQKLAESQAQLRQQQAAINAQFNSAIAVCFVPLFCRIPPKILIKFNRVSTTNKIQ